MALLDQPPLELNLLVPGRGFDGEPLGQPLHVGDRAIVGLDLFVPLTDESGAPARRAEPLEVTVPGELAVGEPPGALGSRFDAIRGSIQARVVWSPRSAQPLRHQFAGAPAARGDFDNAGLASDDRVTQAAGALTGVLGAAWIVVLPAERHGLEVHVPPWNLDVYVVDIVGLLRGDRGTGHWLTAPALDSWDPDETVGLTVRLVATA